MSGPARLVGDLRDTGRGEGFKLGRHFPGAAGQGYPGRTLHQIVDVAAIMLVWFDKVTGVNREMPGGLRDRFDRLTPGSPARKRVNSFGAPSRIDNVIGHHRSRGESRGDPRRCQVLAVAEDRPETQQRMPGAERGRFGVGRVDREHAIGQLSATAVPFGPIAAMRIGTWSGRDAPNPGMCSI